MHLTAAGLVIAAGLVTALALGACSRPPPYPRCDRDDQCTADGANEYCVSGICVYCRTAGDCSATQMCRAGSCVDDPSLATPDAGAEAGSAPAQAELPDLPPLPKRRRRPSHRD